MPSKHPRPEPVTLPSADEAAAVSRLAGGVVVYATTWESKDGKRGFNAALTYPGIPKSYGKPETNVNLTTRQIESIQAAIDLGVSADDLLAAIFLASERANEWRQKDKALAAPAKPTSSAVGSPKVPTFAAKAS